MPCMAIDLFCGIGGLTKGLSLAGIDVLAGFDIDESCQFAYEANNAAEFICEDVTNIEGAELNQMYPDNVVRALVGCAPCQPFSRYSSRYRKEGHTDNKWRLLYSFERLVRETLPDIVSMENVPNLIHENVFNVSLMIYNIIEYTVTNLIDSIYDEIRINHLSYIDVNDSIRSLWRKTILKSVNDPNANFSTFLKKNEEIISAILSNNELNMYAKNTLPGGNLDGNSIKETFESHGIRVRTNSRNYRPDILIGIKENRNNLAHGSVSFVEAMREDSIDDIKTSEILVVGFLEELIETVSTYIEEQKYKTS